MEDKSNAYSVKRTKKDCPNFHNFSCLKTDRPQYIPILDCSSCENKLFKVLKQQAFTFLGNETLLVVLFMVSLLYDS